MAVWIYRHFCVYVWIDGDVVGSCSQWRDNTAMVFSRIRCYDGDFAGFHSDTPFPIEGFCWWYPDIDTRYASLYTPQHFQAIESGMTREQVVKMIGEPLFRKGQGGATCQGADCYHETWQYSNDGACRWWDFAWKKVWISFEEGIVQRARGVAGYMINNPLRLTKSVVAILHFYFLFFLLRKMELLLLNCST